MTYDEVPELHFITPIENVPSILEHGIVCNRLAARLTSALSVARRDIQDIRRDKDVPGARPLHAYANLYFHARNPMLFLRQGMHEELCVLSVRKEVILEPDVVVTDQNAASPYARFAAGVDGLRIVNSAATYAEDWRHADRIAYLRHRSQKCAEVLVPDRVVPSFVRGAYVSCEASRVRLDDVTPSGFPIKISPSLFFR